MSNYTSCPKCKVSPFNHFHEINVVNYLRKFFRLKSKCIICWDCKEIVGYEV